MKQYIKNNPYEYIEDNKHFITKIKECRCLYKESRKYHLNCHLVQRGLHEYTYDDKTNYINNYNKYYYLESDALMSIQAAVQEFNDEVFKLIKNNNIIINIFDYTIYIARESSTRYSCLFSSNDGNVDIKYNSLVSDIINDFYILKYLGRGLSSEEVKEVKNNIKDILLKESHRSGDELFELQIKNYYNIITEDEIIKMGELLGSNLLPLIKEDKEYYIKSNSINKDNNKLLSDSGYSWLHRPAFAMVKSTRNNYTINPHYKSIVDAAPNDVAAITFDEFLNIIKYNI